jgi:type I restriction enzyme R subunit
VNGSTQVQSNFGFLESHSPMLHRLAQFAERYFADDPSTSIFKLRQFGENLVQQMAAITNTFLQPNSSFIDAINALRYQNVLNEQAADAFHLLRKEGNKAAHEMTGAHQDALTMLKVARALGAQYHRMRGNREFKLGPFIPPPDPNKQAAEVADQLTQLQKELQGAILAKEQAQAVADTEAQARAKAEADALMAAEEKAVWASIAEETEQQLAEQKKQQEELLLKLREEAESKPEEELKIVKDEAASIELELDENATRQLIDQKLCDAGWEADSVNYRYAKGVRPQKGRNLAIAEWPTATGPADYVLFIGLMPIAIVEAKRKNKNVKSAIEQAKRYSKGFELAGDLISPGGPWEDYKVPFLFSTNGRAYLRQLLEFSGIWFLDARLPTNHPRALEGWYTPDGLMALAKKDIAQATQALEEEELDYLGLRPYQNEAIKSVEAHLAQGQQHILLAMATGTGKTRTAIGLIYRLLKAKRFNRILFLVDRTSLGEQAHNAFKDVKMENLQTFSDIYEVKGLGDLTPDVTTRVHLSTVQAMVRRCLYTEDGSKNSATVDQYDCVIVDECHRGYNLDREMSDAELEFRSEDEYISAYRRVLDHFDAVRIGLTATPALHTVDIFGQPAFQYSYRQAVIEGFLVDHEPPIQIVTALAEDGMTWKVGEPMQVYHVKRQTVDLVNTPDEVTMKLESFNKRVVTENFNRVICHELARQIDPTLPGKTLIFCATDVHADMVVRLLTDEMEELYGGVNDKAIRKITGAADKPAELIRRYKNEHYPSVAVTVDLLTTGIDVPKIVNLVFLRRVRSRILYEQMLGRATRLCPDIDKEVFRIFDAVQLYEAMQDYTDMKPVVVNPTVSYEQLAKELAEVPDPAAKQEFLEQLITKLQRKKLSDTAKLEFEVMAGMPVKELVAQFRRSTPDQVAEWLTAHPSLSNFLDTVTGEGTKLIVSDHEDEVRRVERGYGAQNRKPADYLEDFASYLEDNLNKIPALLVVTQRPRDLTRGQLKELEKTLAQDGYTATNLRTAWRDTTNVEIAASIIGFIRQRALGCPLTPYAERVDHALKKILSKRAWTAPQRNWLNRIAKQMKQETVVDREALDRGQFKSEGGFNRLNKIFEGQMEAILGDLQEAAWDDDAA